MDPTRHASPFLAVAAVIAILIAAYIGTYCAMVHAVSLRYSGGGPVFPVYSRGNHLDAIQNYFARRPGDRDPLETVFAPVHWLDCRLRPHVWNP